MLFVKLSFVSNLSTENVMRGLLNLHDEHRHSSDSV
jgi:hypothetical protein